MISFSSRPVAYIGHFFFLVHNEKKILHCYNTVSLFRSVDGIILPFFCVRPVYLWSSTFIFLLIKGLCCFHTSFAELSLISRCLQLNCTATLRGLSYPRCDATFTSGTVDSHLQRNIMDQEKCSLVASTQKIYFFWVNVGVPF